MLSPLTPEFIERFEAIVESDKPVANKFAESLILIFDERLKVETGGEPSRLGRSQQGGAPFLLVAEAGFEPTKNLGPGPCTSLLRGA
jgi:hypothetical protein